MRNGILLIDDDQISRRAIVGALREDGIELTEVASVQEGLELLEKTPQLQVILLDMHFPDDISGRVVLEKLKEMQRSSRVIVHTGRDDLLPTDRARDLGVFLFLSKSASLGSAGLGMRTPPLYYLKFAIEQAFKDIESEHLQRRMAHSRTLWQMINAQHKPEAVLERVCQYVLEEIDGYTCHIRRLDPRKGDYELVAFAGPKGVRSMFSHNKKLDELFSGEVARSGKPATYPNIQSNPRFTEFKADLLGQSLSKVGRTYLNTIQSAYIIPIRTDLVEDPHQVDAILNVSGAEENFFTAEKRQLVDELMEPARMAVTKHWLLEKRGEILTDYKDSNELLVKISEKLQKTKIEKIFATVLTGISKIIKPELISLFLYNESTKQIEKRAEFVGGEMRFDRDESYASGECLTGRVFSSSEPLLINESPTEHKYYDKSRKEIDHLIVPSGQIKHYLAAPLIAAGKVIGVIRSVNKRSTYYDEQYPNVSGSEHCLLPRGFSADCKIILGIIASHLAVAINNSQLIGKLNDKISQHDALAKVGQSISANYGLETANLLQLIVEETAKVMNSTICMLFLKTEEGDRVVLKRCHGISLHSLPPDAHYRLGERNTGKVAKTGKPISSAVGTHDGKYDREILGALQDKYGKDTKLTSFMIVPITIEDDSVREKKIIGVLKVINKTPANLLFDPDDLSLFQSFASQISVALVMSESNKSHFRLVQGVGHEIENSVINIPKNAEMAERELGVLKAAIDASQALANEDILSSIGFLKDILETIHLAAQEGVDFALDMLGFSEKQFRQRTVEDINELLQREIKKFRDQPPPSVVNTDKVEFKFEGSKHPMKCSIYHNPLSRAVRNIIANAYQAMEDRPRSRLTVRTYIKHELIGGRQRACIDFKDTGKGIEASKLHRIYDVDFSERDGGNGLGLWLVRGSLRRMDAAISVKSKPNKGTTFTIEMPLANS
jgi:signal transduction histidine kinase/CheY-like chemotaxis protein